MATEPALRQSLARQLKAARQRTDALFGLVTPEGLRERPIAERHRLIFYVGHLEAFDWNLICRDALGHPATHPHFERLFAFGIDPVDGDRPNDGPGDWPDLAEVARWSQRARTAVDDALAQAPFTGWLEDGWALRLALEHRLMHAETLCYLLCRMAPHFKVRGPLPSADDGPPAEATPVAIPPGAATFGLSRQARPRLGWDNEYGEHRVDVPGFEIARAPVSNADWLEFVAAGGYRERSLWDADAWAWRDREGLAHPAFWKFHEGRWWWRAMFGDVPLPGRWPVYVSHAEATAYARWKGGRLPTEAQWHRAADGLTPEKWAPGVEANFGGSRFDPVASAGAAGGATALGVADLIGNGWEWTSTVFAPFEGFAPLPFYPGYSANFFDGKHFVMKGASAATDAVFLRPSFRNWFQPHYPHVFAKFRLVTGAST